MIHAIHNNKDCTEIHPKIGGKKEKKSEEIYIKY